MASKKAKTRVNRRDRRKAKQTKYRRAGTKNPKKVAHHPADEAAALGNRRSVKPPKVRKKIAEQRAAERANADKKRTATKGELSPMFTKAELKKLSEELE